MTTYSTWRPAPPWEIATSMRMRVRINAHNMRRIPWTLTVTSHTRCGGKYIGCDEQDVFWSGFDGRQSAGIQAQAEQNGCGDKDDGCCCHKLRWYIFIQVGRVICCWWFRHFVVQSRGLGTATLHMQCKINAMCDWWWIPRIVILSKAMVYYGFGEGRQAF